MTSDNKTTSKDKEREEVNRELVWEKRENGTELPAEGEKKKSDE